MPDLRPDSSLDAHPNLSPDPRIDALVLSQTRGVGARKYKLLLEHFGDAASVLAASLAALCAVEGIGKALATRIHHANREAARALAQRTIEAVEARAHQLVILGSDQYPEALATIYDPPPIVYLTGALPAGCQGAWAQLRSISLVGTRDASGYALAVSQQLASDFAAAGVVVVSRLALGIDSAAHRGAIDGQGQTVAVLGSSLDIIYPPQNQQLAARIATGAGALVSEYPPSTTPSRSSFPARNRIINGLSKAVIVVEGGVQSGALITADYALQEGRSVFAVPGRVGDSKASGVLKLLKQGAGLVQSAEDVLSELGWDYPTPSVAPDTAAEHLSGLEPLSQQVMMALHQHDAPLLDTLLLATDSSADALLPVLTMLELRGLIRCLPSGRYQRVGQLG